MALVSRIDKIIGLFCRISSLFKIDVDDSSLAINTRMQIAPSQDRDVERWGAGVETQKNVRGEIGGWGRVPFNEPYAPSLSTIYDGA